MRAPRERGGLASLALVALLATGLGTVGAIGGLAGPSQVRAATPDLTLVTATTYQVLPDEGRVAVTVAITATNHLKDTVTKRYYFDEGFLAVLPGTENFKLTAKSGKPSVAVSSRKGGAVVLRIKFGSRLAAGKSLALTLTYDLVDPGGEPDRALRISPSIVAFEAWASASTATPGSSVEVRIPAGYTIGVGRGPLTGPINDGAGWQVLTSGPLETPLTFVADLTADRPGAYVDGRRSATVGDATVFVTFQAWPDDAAWRERVSDLVLRGLPVLAEQIGAPWPLENAITVAEVLVRKNGGFEGVFDPETGLVQIGYTASPGVVLHEAAHGWFNGNLVAERWIAEAFASLYAETAAAALDVPIASPDLAAVPPGAAFPLNDWRPAGEATSAEDEYGFAAALALAREIEAVVGEDVLRETWRAAAVGEPAYQLEAGTGSEGEATAAVADSAGGTETGAAPPDWRALLDLLEANADPDQALALEGLWRRWVIRLPDAGLLDARTEARAAYEAIVEAAAPWTLPRQVRDAMRSWQFEPALNLIEDASSVLRQREAVAEAATDAGLSPPETLRLAFEGDAGLATAAAEAATELAAIDAIQAAGAARMANPNVLDRIGLIGEDPDGRLAAARAAFEAGDQDAALAAAGSAEATWRAVPDIARGRILSAALFALALLLFAWLLIQHRRRPRQLVEHAHPADRARR